MPLRQLIFVFLVDIYPILITVSDVLSLQIMSADNKILQDQLQTKVRKGGRTVIFHLQHISLMFLFKQVSENAELQETVAQLKRQISEPSTSRSYPKDQADEFSSHENIPSRTAEENKESPLKSQVLMQVSITSP